MKTIQKKSVCKVSDRAYRIIFLKCMKEMIDRGVPVDIFAMTLLAVQKYLETGFPPIGGDELIMELFHTFQPEMDLAMRRAASARKAAETRRNKKQSEQHPQSGEQTPEPQEQPHHPLIPAEKATPAPSVQLVPSRAAPVTTA